MYQVFVLGGDICNSLTFTASTEAKHTKKCYIKMKQTRLKRTKLQVQENSKFEN